MNRVIKFEEDYSPDELVRELLSAGFPESTTLAEILRGKVDDADEVVCLKFVIDEDDAVERIHEDTIVQAYKDMGYDGREDRSIEDGIRYVRAGDLSLAGAMFARVFDGVDLQAAQRALS